MSMYKPSSSSSRPVQRSRSVGHSAPAYAPRHASARSPPRPYVTIQTNGGPPQAVPYGTSYIIQSPSPVSMQPPMPIVYPLPASSSPVYINSVPSPISTRPPVHRSMSHVQSPLRTTAPSTPTRSGSGSRTPSTPRAGGGGGYGGPGGRPVASRQSSTPVTYDRDGNPGIMCNGKLIVGDPDEVKRYVSAQESIQKWRENVR
ncbi:hypothetical protein DL93DRAFT_2077471 [Clavulina sp. PMI_390]|nr:hypothetical protein DL93DRAFT_2077471 [Clavulina sp. PMI_390]